MADAHFLQSPNRYDPYKNFRFLVKWDNKYVAGVSEVSGLVRRTEPAKHGPGGDSSTTRASPGQTRFEPITLERGVTHDADFEAWVNKVWDPKNSTGAEANADQLISLRDFRKDITIEVKNEAGQTVIAYHIYRCWVSEYHAMPELDGMGNAIAIQTIKLENEGWARDESVQEPDQPSYNDPSS